MLDWRRTAALLLALPLGLFPAIRTLREPRTPWAPPNAAAEADAAYGPVRASLPSRVGFCADVDPSMARWMSRWDRTSQRVARRFLAQFALAPVIVVPVLGQPSNGQLEPSPEDRAARLAELDLVLVEAGTQSDCWRGAIAAGFVPERGAGMAVRFRRAGR